MVEELEAKKKKSVNVYLVVIIIIGVILLVVMSVFISLYVKDKGKTEGLNEQFEQCKDDRIQAQNDRNISANQLAECLSSKDQLNNATIDNFVFDTSGMTNPIFIRDAQDQTRCNFPVYVFRHVNQGCNFAFNGRGNPRCSAKGASKGKGSCDNTKFTKDNTNLTPYKNDPFLFAGFDDDSTPCHFWKIISYLDPKVYTTQFSYYTDSKIEEVVYSGAIGNGDSVDSSVTSPQKGDSCVPNNIRCKVTIRSVTTVSDFYFPAPSDDFIITVWYDKDQQRPTSTVSYAII